MDLNASLSQHTCRGSLFSERRCGGVTSSLPAAAQLERSAPVLIYSLLLRAHFTDGQTESARGQVINLSVEVLAQNQFVLQTLTLIPEGLGTFCGSHSASCDLHPEKT